MTSDVIPKVDKWPFRACAIKNTQYNPYLWRSLRNSRVLYKIGVEEHDGEGHMKISGTHRKCTVLVFSFF